jgi:uncharacterized phage-associated protein
LENGIFLHVHPPPFAVVLESAQMVPSTTRTTPAYDARAVANYFLELASLESIHITPMAMQKLVYFAHGWMLGVYGRPLISQRIEAWDYGPVISDLYQAFKRYGNLPITEPAHTAQMIGSVFRVTVPQIPKHQDPGVASLIGKVWATYKHFTAIQLSNMTHTPGSPWSTARENNQTFIDDDVMKKYFSEIPR